jgi:formylmethanofuran dehydrogenase subunit E
MPKSINILIKDVRKLHGHIGPYVVIGLKIGEAAKKALQVSDKERTILRANAQVPLSPPFSCLLDGIQVSTTCTVGNQRLTIQNSNAISVTFSRTGTAKTARITLKPELTETLRQGLAENSLTEEFAMTIASTPENQLLNITLEKT